MVTALAIHAAVGGVLRTRRPNLAADVVDDLAGSITDSIMGLINNGGIVETGPGGTVLHPATVTVTPGPNPATVAAATMRALRERELPPDEVVLPKAPAGASGVSGNGRDGKVTERDRFLDDANDRRTALSAAARYMAIGELLEPDILIELSDTLYRHLREGKPE